MRDDAEETNMTYGDLKEGDLYEYDVWRDTYIFLVVCHSRLKTTVMVSEAGTRAKSWFVTHNSEVNIHNLPAWKLLS